jgi:hypothetical protein
MGRSFDVEPVPCYPTDPFVLPFYVRPNNA